MAVARRHQAPKGAPAGTSSARRWRGSISASGSTSTAAASISCFRITRTSSRRHAARSMPTRMAQVWMHNGFLQVEGDKMSKSLGNFVTINELLATDTFGGRKWPGDVLRLAMLRTHYRSPLDWTLASLEESERVLQSWIDLLERHEDVVRPADAGRSEVIEALADDLNTSQAIAELHGWRDWPRAGMLRRPAAAHVARIPRRPVACVVLDPPEGRTLGGCCAFDRRAKGRARAKGLQGVRSHPRRAR